MHGTVFFRACGLCSVIIHGDPLSRMHNFNGQAPPNPLRLKGVFKGVAIPDQQDAVAVFSGGKYSAFNLGRRGLVAPHRVYSNGDHSSQLSPFPLLEAIRLWFR